MPTPQPRRTLSRPPKLDGSSLYTASTPNLSTTYSVHPPPISPSAAISRKHSYNQLVGANTSQTASTNGRARAHSTTKMKGGSSYPPVPRTPVVYRGTPNEDIQVGDLVDAPGNMYGVVKYVGPVTRREGVYVGVELDEQWANRGKNNGEAGGVQYFTPSIPGSGIFLPLDRTRKHALSPVSSDSYPPSPSLDTSESSTPSLSKTKFKRSLGPNTVLRPRSRNPSLGRPESPTRKLPVTPGGRTTLATSSVKRPGTGSTSGTATSPGSKLRRRSDSESQSNRIPATPKIRSAGGIARPLSRIQVRAQSRAQSRSQSRPPSRSQSRSQNRIPQYGNQSRSQSISEAESALDEEQEKTPIGISQTRDALSEDSLSPVKSPSRSQNLVRHDRNSQPKEGDQDELRRELERMSQQMNELELAQSQNLGIQQLQQCLEDRERQLKERDRQLEEFRNSLSKRSRSGGSFGSDTDPQLRKALQQKNQELEDKNRKIAELKGRNTELAAAFDLHRTDFRETLDTLEKASEETQQKYEDRILELVSINGDLEDRIRDLESRDDDVESVATQFKQLEELVSELEEGLDDARRAETDAKAEVEFLKGEVDRGKAELEREKGKVAEKDDEIRGLKAIIHSLSSENVPPPPMSTRNSVLSKESVIKSPENTIPSPEATPTMSTMPTMPPTMPENESPIHDSDPPTLNEPPESDSPTPHGQMPDPSDLGAVAGKTSGIIDESKWCALCERDGHDSTDCPYEDAF